MLSVLKFALGKFITARLASPAKIHIRIRNDQEEHLLETDDLKRQGDHPHFVLVIKERDIVWDILKNPDPGLGEAYMEGQWHLAQGDIGEFITYLASGRIRIVDSPLGRIFNGLLNIARPHNYDHSPEANYELVQHHYDIGDDLYELFLDEGMNYSCAFFETPDQSLRDAQLNKIRTSIKRLGVEPDMKVLDIGCGWGETTRIIAQEAGAQAHGITLAENQIATAHKRAKGIKPEPEYFLKDYREHASEYQEYYDRIISIGMLEHVGDESYNEYFQAVRSQLKPGGKALIHSIVRSGEESTAEMSSPWLDKYIFPGGCIPEIKDMIEIAQSQGLRLAHEPYIQDSFHYAETLRRWRANFLKNQDKLPLDPYDKRFRRMWIYYLAMCEAMFEGCGFRVVQNVFEKPD